MIARNRRLRQNENLRKLNNEMRQTLIHPLFIQEGTGIKQPIAALPGVCRYTTDRVGEQIEFALSKGVDSFLLFGIPSEKDDFGSGAYDENGVIQNALRSLKERYPEICLITDVCMCEYTSHGHCGVLVDRMVDNDKTLKYLQKIALSHVQSGADIVAPSDMMDGHVQAIREVLDENGFIATPIMSYAVKFASAFYGPFREAAGSAPAFGDRKSYQMDYHNRKEALKMAHCNVEQGADIIIVKPALSYLDIVREVSLSVPVPVAAYSVSGEYAMIKYASKADVLQEEQAFDELSTAVFRAGANILISYHL